MIQVYHITISVADLERIPENERSLAIIMGYVSNQLSMLQKVIVLATNEQPVDAIEQYASGAQTQMLLRLMIGATHEAYEKIKSLYLSTDIGRNYSSLIGDPGQNALSYLKKKMGKSSKISQIRNRFGFHLPSTVDINAAYQSVKNDPNLNDKLDLYFSNHGFNSLFLISDIIFSQGIANIGGSSDWEISYQEILGELVTVCDNVIEFARAYFAAVWVNHVGSELQARTILEIRSAKNIDKLSLPFFVNLP